MVPGGGGGPHHGRRIRIRAGRSCAEAGAEKPAPKAWLITIDKATFGSTPAGVAVGDTIEWVNNDIFDHTATAKTGTWDVVIPAGKRARAVMKKAGTFEYYCKFHPNMVATVTVKK